MVKQSAEVLKKWLFYTRRWAPNIDVDTCGYRGQAAQSSLRPQGGPVDISDQDPGGRRRFPKIHQSWVSQTARFNRWAGEAPCDLQERGERRAEEAPGRRAEEAPEGRWKTTKSMFVKFHQDWYNPASQVGRRSFFPLQDWSHDDAALRPSAGWGNRIYRLNVDKARWNLNVLDAMNLGTSIGMDFVSRRILLELSTWDQYRSSPLPSRKSRIRPAGSVSGCSRCEWVSSLTSHRKIILSLCQ